MNDNLDLYQYSKTMSEVKLIRWKDLPLFDIYCDQLLQIVEDGLTFMQTGKEKLITKSMINNYVKWGMMPKPDKKKYDKLHIAYVLVITVLKPVLPIVKIKEGIQLQVILQGNGGAYDAFCEAFEESLRKVFTPILDGQDPYILKERTIEYDKLAITSVTTALSYKLLTEKIIETKINKINVISEGEAHE
jgi:hypothetical protein